MFGHGARGAGNAGRRAAYQFRVSLVGKSAVRMQSANARRVVITEERQAVLAGQGRLGGGGGARRLLVSETHYLFGC